MFQGYCRDDTSHEGQLAYDFLMPIGSPVVAARSGVVKEVKEDVADDAFTSALNYVLVEHDDGTVAFYAHLTKDGVLPEVGRRVEQGEQIALSGSSGRTGELLHFGVYRAYPPREGTDLAVDFSNADGPLDERGGLRDGAYYRALG
jgi:murein DD-endopeptidase MepM/ murein hydrolase activator NlpD